MPHWRWQWHAEVEDYPAAVFAAHHACPNLGDVTARDFCERAERAGRPDVIVFGSPCQGYSIAGKRLGLADPRGHLTLTALSILERLRPRWFVFENVPGLLSNWSGFEESGVDAGRTSWEVEEINDFTAFLAGADAVGYHVAWDVLDAQWFGLAQRRERVIAVGHLGDWRGPAAVLFEPGSLRGDTPPRRKTGQDVAGTVTARSKGRGADQNDAADGRLVCEKIQAEGYHGDQAATVSAKWHKGAGGPAGDEHQNLVAFTCKDSGQDAGAISPTLRSMNETDSAPNGGGQVAVAFHGRQDPDPSGDITHPLDTDGYSVAIAIQERAGAGNPDSGPDGVGARDDDCAYTLEARQKPQAVAFKASHYTRGKDGAPSDIVPPLAVEDDRGDQSPLVMAVNLRGREGGNMPEIDDVAALRAASGGSSRSLIAFDETQVTSPDNRSKPLPGAPCHALTADARLPAIAHNYVVRRLTPLECERLQGFPDFYTLIEWPTSPRPAHELLAVAEYLIAHGFAPERAEILSKTPDGPRYKAIGNSMAVNKMRWVLQRVEQVDAILERSAA